MFEGLKSFLETSSRRFVKRQSGLEDGQLHHESVEYAHGYCENGQLHINNNLDENAIRHYAIGRCIWLFADTPRGARTNTTSYNLL
ncbi:MAG: transposase [Candidatus Thiodiazotropha sp. 6PLUC1]